VVLPVDLPARRRQRRQRRVTRPGVSLPAAGTKFWSVLTQGTAAVLAWRVPHVGTVDLDVPALAPRYAPHALVLSLVVAAVLAGGFSRPDPGFISAMGIEQGHLSIQARLALGPRAADVQVRDALVRPALSTTTLAPSQPRAAVVTYTVQPGDTVWGIGARYGVGAYSVLWSNGLDEDDLIKPGEQLLVPPVPGALHTIKPDDSLDSIAKKFNVDPAAIVDFNGLKPGEALTPDKVLVVPGGSLPIAPRPVAPPPPPVQRTIPPPAAPAPRTTTIQPQPRTQTRPPAPVVPPAAPAAPTGRLSWPTRGVITTYFSSWHPGIDIAASLGSFIGAADGGRVVFAGWDNSGYGYRVIVDHGNGYTTTYNHLSVISVRVGQSVGKGGQIGLMGSTGNSTGPLLHFEILRGGRYINPLGALS
jgi:murein DD-endopeptidase MepM/ murein hydrolase activator NlpD